MHFVTQVERMTPSERFMSRQSCEICYVVDSGELFRLVALHFHMHAEGNFDVIQSIHLSS